MKIKKKIVAGWLIAAAAVLVYIPSIGGEFIWDDDRHLVNDPFMGDLDGLRRIWLAPESFQIWNYWPISRSSFWLERRIWGLDATGYRLVNLALHAGNAVLLWKILAALGVPGGWLAALIFAIHPVNVETAAWVTQRKNTLSMLFYLLAIKWYLDFDREGDRGRYKASLTAFAGALLAKTATVPLPAVLVLMAVWKGRPRLTTAIRRAAPFFVLAVAAGLVSVWFERSFIGPSGPGFHLLPAERAILAGRAFWFYLGKALWPHPVMFVYPRWELDSTNPIAWLPLIALAVALAIPFLLRRRGGGGIFFGLAYFAACLFPVTGISIIYFMHYSFVADHWQYLALPGIIALAVALAVRGLEEIKARAGKRRRQRLSRAEAWGAAAIVLVLAVLTWNYSRSFRGLEPIWRDTIRKNPSARMAHNNLGVLLYEKDRYLEAIRHFDQAIGLDPDDPQVHYNYYLNRGNAFRKLGRDARALDDLNRAAEIAPVKADVYFVRGDLHREMGDLRAAVADWDRTISLAPNFPDAYFNRANARLLLGDPAGAAEDYRRVIEINPNDHQAHYYLGVVLESMDEIEAALESYDRAIQLNPGSDDYHRRRQRLLERRQTAGNEL